jgi:hypothetical protein
MAPFYFPLKWRTGKPEWSLGHDTQGKGPQEPQDPINEGREKLEPWTPKIRDGNRHINIGQAILHQALDPINTRREILEFANPTSGGRKTLEAWTHKYRMGTAI